MFRNCLVLVAVLSLASVCYAGKPGGGGTITPDYPGAKWVAANSRNYTKSTRPSTYPINYWVNHVTQGSYAGTISWFQNASSAVSTHYVARSSDGELTQMVKHKDVAWHAGNWSYNTWSLGIEHEGYIDNPAWFTDAMYTASAACCKYACENGTTILKDRVHILGHNEVPGATHTDPGAYWNWDKYMALVTGTSSTFETVIVDNANAGFAASGEWSTGTSSVDRYGADYRYSSTGNSGGADLATWNLNVPASASDWEVSVWYSQGTNRSTAAPYSVNHAAGTNSFAVNQQNGGGQFRVLGTFSINAGTGSVTLSDNAASGYVVIADAVRARRPI